MRNSDVLFKFWEAQESGFEARIHAIIPTIYGFQIHGIDITEKMTSVQRSAAKLYACCGACFKPHRDNDWVRYATRYMIGLKNDVICMRSNHTTVCAFCCPEFPFVSAGRANFHIFDQILQAQWKKLGVDFFDHDWVSIFFHSIEEIADSVRRQDLSCDFCRKEFPLGLKRCSSCKTTHYCTKECQVAHWKFHKNVCGWIKGRTWLLHRIKFHR